MRASIYVGIICFLILLLVAILTFCIYLYVQVDGCIRNPYFWCWNDFTCPAGTALAGKKPEDVYGIKSKLNEIATQCRDSESGCPCAWSNGNNTCMNSFCNSNKSDTAVWNPYDSCRVSAN